MREATESEERDAVGPSMVGPWLDENLDARLTLGEWWKRTYEAGLAFPEWPAVAGGQSASSSDVASINDEFAKRDVPPSPRGNGVFIGVPVLLELGTESQIEEFLPALTQGQEAWCQLFSEPDAGSDLASLQTTAERDGEEWVVNGQKVWCTQGDIADRGLLVARTNGDAPKHAGLTFFVIDMNQPGVEVRPIRQLDGHASFTEVFLTDARIPAGRIVGGVGNGWAVTTKALAFERRNISKRQRRGAQDLHPGTKGGNLHRTLAELSFVAGSIPAERRNYALPFRQLVELARQCGVDDDRLVRQRLIEYFCQTELRRLTEMRYRSGLPLTFASGAVGPMSKLALSQIARVSRNLIFEIAGMNGVVEDGDSLFTMARETALASFAVHFGGGTDEIQRNVIAERGLGLPRDPSSDAESSPPSRATDQGR